MDLRTFLAAHGAKARLAAALGCPGQLVWQWATGVRPVPAARCVQIERATQGRVRCEEIRPDISWTRIPDRAWAWHSEGKPLVDVLPTNATDVVDARRVAGLAVAE